MADKKLNQVSQLTDFDYALVVKGNDVAKVTKQQLATILGGNNPLFVEYGFCRSPPRSPAVIISCVFSLLLFRMTRLSRL